MEKTLDLRGKVTTVGLPVKMLPVPTMPCRPDNCAGCQQEIWVEESTLKTLAEEHQGAETTHLCPMCLVVNMSDPENLASLDVQPLAEAQKEDLRQVRARREGRGNN